MKKSFVKALLGLSIVAFLYNCGDDSSTSSNILQQAFVVNAPSFVYESDGVTYLIDANGIVKNVAGEIVGAADINSGLIVATDQTIIAQNVDFNSLQILQPTVIASTAWVLSVGENYVIYPAPSYIVTNSQGVQVGSIVFAEGSTIGNIVNDAGEIIFENVDVSQLKVYESNIVIASSSSEAFVVPPITEPIDNPTSSSEVFVPETPVVPTSSFSNVRSSSSAKSSSSQAKSSSSVIQASLIKYVNGGVSGSGWASRYWDCCKPHCAWPDKGGLKAHACDASGNKIGDDNATSMCDGGNAGTCVSQIPIVINDTLAYAFAAVPAASGGQCGKCFDLQFTGTGKYATDNHKKLKGKHLIVIASNVGGDVEQGQFDIMIPGGGFGIFDGCSARMGWGPQGERYGGLLSECENSSGYNASTYKSCLTQKCNSSFSSDPKAKEGCLFLANWMNAAGNPLHNYKEVECPKELLDKF